MIISIIYVFARPPLRTGATPVAGRKNPAIARSSVMQEDSLATGALPAARDGGTAGARLKTRSPE